MPDDEESVIPKMFRTLTLLALMRAASSQSCKTDVDCMLNGFCSGGECICVNPWYGPQCESLAYAMTPASGKVLFDSGASHNNTWGGPIMTAPDGTFHLFSPLYKNGSLGGPTTTLHGVASVITGPYDWNTYPNLPLPNINPASVTFVDPATNKTVYTLWSGGQVHVADSPASEFVAVAGFTYPGVNPAPIFHNGAWFMTNQRTTTIYTTPRLEAGALWTVFANISHATLPANLNVEDPFMWIDGNGNWHIIGHAYNNFEYKNCAQSALSSHFFSPDGVTWYFSLLPYNHTVVYDDGTEHMYITLERPFLHIDATGALKHLVLAADLITGDEGCGARTDRARNGHTPCDDCKWDDLAGTTIITFAG